jgi:hypothetical protein
MSEIYTSHLSANKQRVPSAIQPDLEHTNKGRRGRCALMFKITRLYQYRFSSQKSYMYGDLLQINRLFCIP